MGYWAKLVSRAAFRDGQANYCGYLNNVTVGTWSGGMVGLKSILGVKCRQTALDIMDALTYLGYIEYSLDPKTKKFTYKILDYVVKCSGEPCLSPGAVYATDGYGFICLPRCITQRLADDGYTFDEVDAWLDLWCHTVWQDQHNIFSKKAPAVQYGQYGIVLTLEILGQRWGWEKTKVWRFLQKHTDTFMLRKLPGSYGCLIFNRLYPVDNDFIIPEQPEIISILDGIRSLSQNTHLIGTDNERINKLIAWHSQKTAYLSHSEEPATDMSVSDEKLIADQNAHLDVMDCETFISNHTEAVYIFEEICITDLNTDLDGTPIGLPNCNITGVSLKTIQSASIIGLNIYVSDVDDHRFDIPISWCGQAQIAKTAFGSASQSENRVAVSDPITRAYISPPNCKHCIYDCWRTVDMASPFSGILIRGPCNDL